MKRIVFVTLLMLVALLVTGCGPWSRDRECASGVRNLSGCVPRSEDTEAWLRKEGYLPSMATMPTMPTLTEYTPPVQPAPSVVQQPTPTPAPPTPATPNYCRVVHDYQLKDLTEVSTSNDGWLHVEYWVGGDAPEYETILPGSRYLLKINFAGGHVWEYSGGCTFEQVKAQVQAHINRRLAQKANNGGYVDWQSTGYFNPVQ